jgi:serine/threonine protein kinase
MSEQLPSNCEISHYRIVSKLGAGGMGEVYLAEDTKLGRKVAIKLLNEEFSRDASKLKRFTQEAKAASALNHPNILTVYEIGEVEGKNYIATELIDGQTVREHLSYKESLQLNTILKIGVQVAEALWAAHQAGIIHRDIKPENIMLRKDRYAKVLDFGLAKLTEQHTPDLVDPEASTRFVVKTDPGVVMGTAIYMSPEQARGLEVDARTDIFSLGVVLYELVAGRLPFEGSTSTEILASILSDRESPPLARYSREVPPELERIVSKALRKDRDERYQTSKDLLLDLQSLQQDLEFAKKLEHSAPPKLHDGAHTQEHARTSVTESPHSTLRVTGLGTTFLRKRNLIGAATLLSIAVLTMAGYFYFTRARTKAISSVAVLPFANVNRGTRISNMFQTASLTASSKGSRGFRT